jgi:predicted ABC-type ATPase
MPNLYIIGGANGSGKTTVAMRLLPDQLNCLEYINADEIARGLSPFNPNAVAQQAGRLMLERIKTLANSGLDFAFETTLAARSFNLFVKNCKSRGYTIILLYFWLRSPELAVERVAKRVASGGHSIPEDVIYRRYDRGRRNFRELYWPLCDRWIVYDNSSSEQLLVAEYEAPEEPIIYAQETWNQIIEV